MMSSSDVVLNGIDAMDPYRLHRSKTDGGLLDHFVD